MIPLGDGEQEAVLATVRRSHAMRIRLSLTDLDGEHLTTLDQRIESGQVNVDADADTATRSLTVAVADPGRRLPFDGNAADDAAVFVDRMLRVHYGVLTSTEGWVDVPVFTGPVTKMNRRAGLVSLEAQGKETLASNALWRPLDFGKNTRKSEVIRTTLREGTGERLFDIPETKARLHEEVSLGRLSIPWAFCKRMAPDGRQLFYDGRGTCRLRREPERSAVRFRAGDGGTVQADPEIGYDLSEVRNVIWVKGQPPKNHKKGDPLPNGIAVAQRHHALSPWNLGRHTRDNDLIPRHLVEVIERDDIRTKKEADDHAERVLRKRLRQAVDVAFESWPVNPLLEELDVCELDTDYAAAEFTLRQFTIPLVLGEAQTIGYLKRVNPDRRRRKKK